MAPQAANFLLLPQGVASRDHDLDPAARDDARCVGVGVLGMPATLADEPALVEPVVRMSVAAGRALLRAMVRRHFDAELACSEGLVLGEELRLTPGGGEDAPIEAALLRDFPARHGRRAGGRAGHVLDLQRFEHEQQVGAVNECATGLVCEVRPDIRAVESGARGAEPLEHLQVPARDEDLGLIRLEGPEGLRVPRQVEHETLVQPRLRRTLGGTCGPNDVLEAQLRVV